MTCADVAFDVYRWLFCFKEKFPSPASSKGVVGGFGAASNFDGILMNDIFICLGISLFVVDVPTKRLAKRVNKFTSNLSFVVRRSLIRILVKLELVNKIVNDFGSAHAFSLEIVLWLTL